MEEPVDLLGQPWDRSLVRVDGFMRSRPLAMSIDDYRALPRLHGLKMEYLDGKLYVESRHLHVPVCARLRKGSTTCQLELRQPKPDDGKELIDLFYESFRGTIDYCDYPPDDIRRSGAECVESFYSGKQGLPMDVSRLAIDDAGCIVGAALIVRGNRGPSLDLLMVRPDRQQCGIASAAVGDAMRSLFAAGEKELHSAFHSLNTPSARWHARLGFKLRPDYLYASFRLNYLEHRLVREHGEEIDADEREAILKERAWLRRLAPALVDEELARHGETDAAKKDALLRHMTRTSSRPERKDRRA